MKKHLTLVLIIVLMGSFSLSAAGEDETLNGSPVTGNEAVASVLGPSGENSLESLNTLKKRRKKRKKGRGRSSGEAFGQGNSVISLGYGVPNLNKSIFKTYESFTGYTVTGSGPFHFKFEYAISDNLGIGLSVNTVNAKTAWNEEFYEFNDSTYKWDTITYTEGFKFFSLAANVRLNYHFITSEKLDVFAGVGLGYNHAKYEYYSGYDLSPVLTLSSILPLGFEITAGMRYFLTDNIGIYLEAGLAKSAFQGGLSIKF